MRTYIPTSPLTLRHRLLSDSELVDDRAVTLDIYLCEIVEKVSSVSYHLEKTATAVVVLVVGLKMLGKSVDSVGKNSDLYLRRTCVTLMCLVSVDDFLLDFLCDHFFHLI